MEIHSEKIINERSKIEQKTILFEQIMNCYQNRIYHFVRRMILQPDDALDVTQNTFLLAWEKLHQFNGKSQFSTWLHQIAYHEALQWIKKQKRIDNYTLNSPGLPQFSHLMVDEQHILQWLYEAIELLPPKQRAVFVLKYFDEKKFEEIHLITGTSVGALKASYHIAVQKVEEFLIKKNHLL